jgi:hypothetical protein
MLSCLNDIVTLTTADNTSSFSIKDVWMITLENNVIKIYLKYNMTYLVYQFLDKTNEANNENMANEYQWLINLKSKYSGENENENARKVS